MTYPQLIQAVEAALTPLANAAGGSVIVAESIEQARAFLDAAPNRWRIILHWEGFGDHANAREGMTSHQVATVIQAPRGLEHTPDITRPQPDGTPGFSTRISSLVGWMGAMRFPNGTGADVAGFAMAGSQWLPTVPNFAAHVINWKLDAALPPYSQTIPLVFPHLS